MATLIKLKKVPVKTAPLTKVHSLVEALGFCKRKRFQYCNKKQKGIMGKVVLDTDVFVEIFN